MFALIGGLNGLITGTLAALAMLGLCAAYDATIDDPGVRREARAGLVSITEVAAAKAQNAELRRQMKAGQATIAAYQSRAEADQRAFAAAEARMEQEIATHESQLAAAGRSCLLSDDDLGWLRKP